MKLPSLADLPILRTTPSLTATTGEPFLAKMLIPRRVGEEEMTSAALPLIRVSVVEFFSASRAASSSEYRELAATGKWAPSVRPVSEPTRVEGMRP